MQEVKRHKTLDDKIPKDSTEAPSNFKIIQSAYQHQECYLHAGEDHKVTVLLMG